MAPDLLYKAFGLNTTINARVCSIGLKIGDRQNQPFSTLLNLTRNYIFASGGQGVKREVGKLGKRGELE
jgi:hypothetical protein